jgi:hypothetical protein
MCQGVSSTPTRYALEPELESAEIRPYISEPEPGIEPGIDLECKPEPAKEAICSLDLEPPKEPESEPICADTAVSVGDGWSLLTSKRPKKKE